jgi:hypothetical protein
MLHKMAMQVSKEETDNVDALKYIFNKLTEQAVCTSCIAILFCMR